jgi:hypothetical protein
MNCYEHPIQPAVAQCPDCGKGLCTECATKYSLPICNTCNKKRINAERSGIIKELLLTYGMGILLGVLFVNFANGERYLPLTTAIMLYVIFSYIFSGIVPGWKTLTRITPAIFLFLPIIGWVLYFIIKLALSLCLGLVMLPIRTFRNIYRLVALQKIKA